ncbi:inc metabolism membrane protein [Tilletia horrida]|uniref:Inc metabolism membrane protein n=1 Tax=Tilletia horrida TaxID=155126 RepID=A0AAN6GH00_9BASI|nr:inc metabolism membrane protein [Tilletia horrida]KAK0539978.1 inc metabolism membrane protein [Tilletia horrida]
MPARRRSSIDSAGTHPARPVASPDAASSATKLRKTAEADSTSSSNSSPTMAPGFRFPPSSSSSAAAAAIEDRGNSSTLVSRKHVQPPVASRHSMDDVPRRRRRMTTGSEEETEADYSSSASSSGSNAPNPSCPRPDWDASKHSPVTFSERARQLREKRRSLPNLDRFTSAFDRIQFDASAWQQKLPQISMDEIMTSLELKLAQSRASAVESFHKAEDALYAAALDLARGGQKLIRYEHLPHLWRNNAHILSGYRFIPIERWPALIRSTFEIHNETGNIMTHLVGIAIIVPLFWPYKDGHPWALDIHTTPMDRLVQTIYLIAAIKCLALSVSWHVMAGCSHPGWFETFACIDYTGVAWLVSASVFTVIYNEFYCQPNLAIFYSFTTLCVGIAGATLPWAKWFNTREAKMWRVAVFLSMAFASLLPFTHAAYEHGLSKTASFVMPIVPSLLAYVFGIFIYALEIPERFAPGRFDIFGHAHQIWHASIIVAILLHWRAVIIWHQNRFEFSCAIDETPLEDLIQQSMGALWLSKAGGLHGIEGLGKADETVHEWRRVLGRLGGGIVGRAWDAGVDWIQAVW